MACRACRDGDHAWCKGGDEVDPHLPGYAVQICGCPDDAHLTDEQRMLLELDPESF